MKKTFKVLSFIFAVVLLVALGCVATFAEDTAEPTPGFTNSAAYDPNHTFGSVIWGQIDMKNGEAIASLSVELYSNDTKLSTTVLNNVDGFLDAGNVYALSWHILLEGNVDSYWTTTWEDGIIPSVAMTPTHVLTYVNGAAEGVRTDIANDWDGGVIVTTWSQMPGVKLATVGGIYYDDLSEAFDAATANKEPVVLLGDITVNAEDDKPETQIWVEGDHDVVIDLNGHTVTGAFFINGTATIKNGDIVNEQLVSAIETKGNLTLDKVSLVSDRHGLRVSGGITNIIYAKIQTVGTAGTRHAINASGGATITIKDGEFIGAGYANLGGSGNCLMLNGTAGVFIEGGKFYGSNGVEGAICADDGLVISGGTFCTWSYNNYLASKKAALKVGDTYEVIDARVQVGENKYFATINDAIAGASAGETVVLLESITETGITVPANKNVIIDLNKKTVTGDFWVEGKATIKNGTITGSRENASTIEANGASADLTVEGLTVASKRHAIRVDGGKATIISGDYSCTNNDGSFYVVNAGGGVPTELTILGGTFTPAKGASTQGTSVMIKDSLVTSTISGGVFNTASDKSLENYGTMTITGGTFYGYVDVNAASLDKVTGGEFEERNQATIAKVDGWYYVTLADAIKNADNGVVTLIANATESGITVPAGKIITIDLGGFTLTGDIYSEGTLTVKNGTIINNNFVSCIESYGDAADLTIDNVTATSSRHALRIEGGVATIISGTFTTLSRGGAQSTHALNAGGAGTTTVTIKGGTFNGIKLSALVTTSDSGSAVNAQAGATVTIENGVFAGGQNNTLATSKDGKIIVNAPTEATFDQDPAAYVVSTDGQRYVTELKGGMYHVVLVTNWLQVADTTWYNGIGTYTLTSAEQLAGLAEMVNNGHTFAGEYIALGNDIDLGAYAWSGIGIPLKPLEDDVTFGSFQGTFDGQGYTVYNVTFADNTGFVGGRVNTYRGFFNCIYNATVKNLTVECEDFEASLTGKRGGAVIVGTAEDSTIESCVATGKLSGSHNIAGIATFVLDSKVLNCTNEADLTSSYSKMGGIVAFCQGSNADHNHNVVYSTETVIDGCVNKGTITSTYTAAESVHGFGGIIGWTGYGGPEGSANIITIKNCVNEGKIIADASSQFVGQIVACNAHRQNVLENNKGLVSLNLFACPTEQNGLNYGIVNGDVVTYIKDSEVVVGGTYLVTAPVTSAPTRTLKPGEEIVFDLSITTVAFNYTTITGDDIRYQNGALLRIYVPAVAEIDGVKYATLEKAFAAVNGDVTITLLANAGDATLASDYTVTLAGAYSVGTITVQNGSVIIPNGMNATVDASVVIENLAKARAAVAAVGGQYFASLQDAIDAAEAGETVKLLDNIDLTDGLEIAADDAIILDLNGKTISYNSIETKANAAITNYGDLTINGAGKVTYNGVGDSAFGYGTNTISNEGGTLTVNGATIENTTTIGSSVAIDNNSTLGDTILVLNSAIVTSEKNAIRQYANSAAVNKVEINGDSEISGSRALMIQLPGGNTADAPKVDADINGGKLTGTGDMAIYSYSYGNSYTDVAVDITGGTIEGPVALGGGSANGGAGAENLTITGGTFTDEVYTYNSKTEPEIEISGGDFEVAPAPEYLAGDAAFLVNPDGSVSVEKEDEIVAAGAVASVNGNYYPTLKAAVEAAVDGQTVTLLNDVENGEGFAMNAAKDIIIDLNGKTYTAVSGSSSIIWTSSKTYNGNGQGIIIKNGTLKAVGNVVNAGITVSYGKLTLSDVIIDMSGVTHEKFAFGLCLPCAGDVTLTGVTEKGTQIIQPGTLVNETYNVSVRFYGDDNITPKLVLDKCDLGGVILHQKMAGSGDPVIELHAGATLNGFDIREGAYPVTYIISDKAAAQKFATLTLRSGDKIVYNGTTLVNSLARTLEFSYYAEGDRYALGKITYYSHSVTSVYNSGVYTGTCEDMNGKPTNPFAQIVPTLDSKNANLNVYIIPTLTTPENGFIVGNYTNTYKAYMVLDTSTAIPVMYEDANTMGLFYVDHSGAGEIVITPATIEHKFNDSEYNQTVIYDGLKHWTEVKAADFVVQQNHVANISYLVYLNAETNEYDLTEAPEFTNAGTYTVKYKVVADNHFDFYGEYTIVINPADISSAEITLDNTTLIYNGAEQQVDVMGVEITLAGGTFPLYAGTDFTFVVGSNLGTDVGTYGYTINGKGNYTGTAKTDWNIVKMDTNTITGVDNHTWTYGDATQDYKAGVSANFGLDASTTVWTLTDPNGTTYTVGIDTLPTCFMAGTWTYKVEIADTNNYNGTSAEGQLIVAKKAITMTIAPVDIIYGDATAASKDYEGVNGETLTINYLFAGADWQAIFAHGTYAITEKNIVVSGGNADLANYDVTVEGSGSLLTVAKKAITLNINDLSMTYGDITLPTYGYTLADGSALVGEDVLGAVAYTLTDADSKVVALASTLGAGTYTISGELIEANYEVTINDATLTVGKKTVTITVNDVPTLEFGDAVPAYDFTAVGLVNGDDKAVLGVTFACDYAVGSPVATYTVTASYSDSIANYVVDVDSSILSKDFQVVLAKINYTIQVPAVNPVYGDLSDITFTDTVNDKNGETLTITYYFNTKAFADIQDANGVFSVGAYTVTAAITEVSNGGNISNYTLEATAQTLTIDKKAISLDIVDPKLTYRADAPTTYELKPAEGFAFVGADTLDVLKNIAFVSTYTNETAVGDGYTVNGTAEADNYLVTINEGSFSIAKGIATSASIKYEKLTYNGSAQILVITGLTVNGKDEPISGLDATSIDTGMINAGNYKITLTFNASSNYEGSCDVDYVIYKYIIESIEWTNVEQVYADGAELAPSVGFIFNGAFETLAVDHAPFIYVGVYDGLTAKLSAEQAVNFAINDFTCGFGTFEITPKYTINFTQTNIAIDADSYKLNIKLNANGIKQYGLDADALKSKLTVYFDGAATTDYTVTMGDVSIMITYSKISAADLDKELYATLIIDEKTYSSKATSIAAYCYTQINNFVVAADGGNEKAIAMMDLMVSLLRYGAASQKLDNSDIADADLMTAPVAEEILAKYGLEKNDMTAPDPSVPGEPPKLVLTPGEAYEDVVTSATLKVEPAGSFLGIKLTFKMSDGWDVNNLMRFTIVQVDEAGNKLGAVSAFECDDVYGAEYGSLAGTKVLERLADGTYVLTLPLNSSQMKDRFRIQAQYDPNRDVNGRAFVFGTYFNVQDYMQNVDAGSGSTNSNTAAFVTVMNRAADFSDYLNAYIDCIQKP